MLLCMMVVGEVYFFLKIFDSNCKYEVGVY